MRPVLLAVLLLPALAQAGVWLCPDNGLGCTWSTDPADIPRAGVPPAMRAEPASPAPLPARPMPAAPAVHQRYYLSPPAPVVVQPVEQDDVFIDQRGRPVIGLDDDLYWDINSRRVVPGALIGR